MAYSKETAASLNGAGWSTVGDKLSSAASLLQQNAANFLPQNEAWLYGVGAVAPHAVLKIQGKQMSTAQILSIPSDHYRLKSPLIAVLEHEDGETVASIPDLEIYGEGQNDTEAIKDLKFELLDLIETVFDEADSSLGKDPLMWKRSLHMVVEKCE